MFEVVEFNSDTAKAIFQGSYSNHLLMFLSKEVPSNISYDYSNNLTDDHQLVLILYVFQDAKFEYVLHDARKVKKTLTNEA